LGIESNKRVVSLDLKNHKTLSKVVDLQLQCISNAFDFEVEKFSRDVVITIKL